AFRIMSFLLLILLLVPLGTAVVVAFLGPHRQGAVAALSLTATVVCAILALIVAVTFAAEAGGPRESDALSRPGEMPTFRPAYVTRFDLLSLGPPGCIQFYIGLDGLNVWLVVLTAVLMVSAVLISLNSPQVQDRLNEYYAWLLTLETGMVGVFLALDIILFYVFFELTLVPFIFLIGIWGGPERRYAARKFFIYTLAGS